MEGQFGEESEQGGRGVMVGEMKRKKQITPRVYSMEDFKHLKQITLKEAEEKGYNLLGGGFGANMGFALYEGILHYKNFVNRVKYFAVVSAIKDTTKNAKNKINQGQMMTFKFYEDKKE